MKYEWKVPKVGSKTSFKLLMLPDTHSPHEDKTAWATMMKFAKAWKPDGILHVGDFADCYSVSFHDRDPRRQTQISEELKEVAALREELDDLGAQLKIITLGNHEHRTERYIIRQAPALYSAISIDQMIGLSAADWKVVPYLQNAKLGKLHMTHEAGYCGVHATYQTGNAFASSVVHGHGHRLGSYYFGDSQGNRHVAAQLGWLGDLEEAKYAPPTTKRFWQHGFGTATFAPDGRFQLQLIPIVDGRCWLGEKVIE